MVEKDTPLRYTPRMKNPSTSHPIHHHSSMRKMMMKMMKMMNKMVRMLMRKNQGSRKMKIRATMKTRMRMTMGLHLEKIGVRRVKVHLEKYHPLHFSSRTL